MGVDGRPFVAELKVQVRAGGSAAGHSDQPNHIPLADTFSTGDLHAAIFHMCVKRLPAIAMVDDNQVTIPPGIPTGIDNHTRIGSIDGIAFGTGKVDPIVANIWTVIGTRKPVFDRGEDERAIADQPTRNWSTFTGANNARRDRTACA